MPMVAMDKKASIESVDIIDVNSAAYISQKNNFLKTLTAFHEQRGLVICNVFDRSKNLTK